MADLHPSDPGYRLLARLIERVAFRLRVETGWNGVVHLAPPNLGQRVGRAFNGGPKVLNAWESVRANGDNSLTVHPTLLRHVLKAQTRRLSVNDNYAAHQSLVRFVHAAVTLSRHDRTDQPKSKHREDAASRLTTIGLSQDWALRRTNEIIGDLDLNTHSPRITSTRVHDLFPAATMTARSFVKGLATSARHPEDVIHRELVGTHPADRWNKAAIWLIESHLAGLRATPTELADLRDQLGRIAHDYYERATWTPSRLSGMPTGHSSQRVELAGALRKRGDLDGRTIVERLNIHIKTVQVNWRQRAGSDPVQEAADASGVDVEKLRAFLAANGGGTVRAGAAQERSADRSTQRDPGQLPSGPTPAGR